MGITPNQSYLAKQMQIKLAACFAAIIAEVSGSAPYVASAWNKPSQVLAGTGGWRKDNQQFRFWGGRGAVVTFSNARWDPNECNIIRGPKRLAENVEVNVDEQDKIIKAGTDIHVAYEESVGLTNSFSSAVTKGMTLDMTASLTSETTVSGEYAGVSAEEKVTASFGVEAGKSEEEEKDKSEEGTKETSVSIDFDAEAGNNYLVSISKEHKTTYQDYHIDGVMDFDIEVQFGRNGHARLHSCYPNDAVKLVGFDGLVQYLHGYDTNHPEMAGFLDKCYSRTTNAIRSLLQPEMRTLVVEGTNEAGLESNADYGVEKLGKSIPKSLAGLPVVDAGDVALDGGPIDANEDIWRKPLAGLSNQQLADLATQLRAEETKRFYGWSPVTPSS